MAPVKSPATCNICGRDSPPEAHFCGQCGAALTEDVHAHATSYSPSAAPLEYIGFWTRAAAAMIDFFTVIAMSVALYLIGALSVFSRTGIGIAGTLLATLSIVLPWLYYWLFTGARGQTPGKMALGIRVADARGVSPGLGRGVLRELVGKTISSVVPLGFLWVVWDRRKQGWHDKLAHTYVVKARSK